MEDQLYQLVRDHLFESLAALWVFNCAVSALQDEPATFFDWFKDFMRALSSPAAIMRRKRHQCNDCPLHDVHAEVTEVRAETALARREDRDGD